MICSPWETMIQTRIEGTQDSPQYGLGSGRDREHRVLSGQTVQTGGLESE